MSADQEFVEDYTAFLDPTIWTAQQIAALHRQIYEIPTLAVQKVTIHHNTSPLPDDLLASRIADVPLLQTGGRLWRSTNAFYHPTASPLSTQAFYSRQLFGDDTRFPDLHVFTLQHGQQVQVTIEANEDIGYHHTRFLPGQITVVPRQVSGESQTMVIVHSFGGMDARTIAAELGVLAEEE